MGNLSEKEQNDVIDVLGHELKTPATIIKLNAQLLEKFSQQIKKDREEYDRYLFRINQAIEDQLKLMDTLLSTSLGSNGIKLNLEKVDILERIDICIDMFEKSAREKNIKIINNADKNTPWILGDKIRVIEILNNLIENAIKFTDKGNIKIETFFDKDSVSLTITDTGIGIKQEDLPNIWKKFYRVDCNTETKYSDDIDIVKPGGTGLGLYVTYNLVKKMNGDITVESRYGEGTTFLVKFPVYQA